MLPTKLTSLKSFRSSAPPFFGISTKKEAFKLFTNLPCSWNSQKHPSPHPLQSPNWTAKNPRKNHLGLELYLHWDPRGLWTPLPQRTAPPTRLPHHPLKHQKSAPNNWASHFQLIRIERPRPHPLWSFSPPRPSDH